MKFWATVDQGQGAGPELIYLREFRISMRPHEEGRTDFLSVQMTEEDELLVLRHRTGQDPECVYSEVKGE